MDTQLVKSWIEYNTTRDKQFFWSWEKLNTIVHRSPDEAFEYILAISEATTDQEIIENLGQGPLEDFLMLYGPDYIDEIEAKARQVPSFLRVIKCVWQNRIDPAVWEKIAAVIDEIGNK